MPEILSWTKDLVIVAAGVAGLVVLIRKEQRDSWDHEQKVKEAERPPPEDE